MYIYDGASLFDWLGKTVFVQVCSKRTVRQNEQFAIFVNFEHHENYFRPGPRLLYATCSFKQEMIFIVASTRSEYSLEDM